MAAICHNYLPPEWAPQYGVMLTWPHEHGDWDDGLPAVEACFVQMASNIARFEDVLIAAHDRLHEQHIHEQLAVAGTRMDRVHSFIATSNDIWVRDHGPLTVLCSNEAKLLDYSFNGWGNKYQHDLDNALSRKLSQQDAFGNNPMETIDWILEGGSIEVDGSGTLLTTESCLRNRNRNPKLSHEQLETILKQQLGLTRILWLHHGQLQGDDTDGHIDTIARYCDRNTIAYVRCNDPRDPHYTNFKAMEAELKLLVNAEGKPYRLVALPWPKPVYNDGGKRLPATYANFLIINGAVLVPLYKDAADDRALEILAGCFPDREIIGINSLPLIKQYGSIHCASMQLPSQIMSQSR